MPTYLSSSASKRPFPIKVRRLDQAEPVELLDHCLRHQTVLMMDVHGSGKSTVLRLTAASLAQSLPLPERDVEIDQWLRSSILPLHVYLARWPGTGTLDSFLQHEFQTQHQTTSSLAALVVQKARNLVLLLDGFDEVHSEGRSLRADDARRDVLSEAIVAFQRRHPDVHVVIASTIAVPKVFPDMVTVEVLRPTAEEIRSLAGTDEILLATLRKLCATGSPLPLEVDLTCFAHEQNIEISDNAGRRWADSGPGRLAPRLTNLLDIYVDTLLRDVSNRDLPALLWLATQLKVRGDSAVFRPSELDPFWLPLRRQRYLAFATMGCAVMLLPALVVAFVAAAVGLPALACALTGIGMVLLGVNNIWTHRFVYYGVRRRKPHAVHERSFDSELMWAELANNRSGFFREAGKRLVFGIVGGLMFAVLRIVIGGAQSTTVGNTTAFVVGVLVLCIAEVVGGGALGQFIAVGVICALAHLGSGSLLAVVLKTGLPAGFASTFVFHLAELGEVAVVSPLGRASTALKRNVVVQTRFEFAQWIMVGIIFGCTEALLFGDPRWLVATFSAVLAAGLFYGVLGGSFPLLLYVITQRRLRKAGILDGELQDVLDRLVSVGMLQKESYGLGVRFIHPTIADAIGVHIIAGGR